MPTWLLAVWPGVVWSLCHSRLTLLDTGETYSNLSVISEFQCADERVLACVYLEGAQLIPPQRYLVLCM